MGIYLQGYGTLPESVSETLSPRIVNVARQWAVQNGIGDLFHAGTPSEKGVPISIYPPAGGVFFELEDGQISFADKTSIAGPGYHAALIRLCDALHKDLGVWWRWESGSDETGYAIKRDFGALQQEFVAQFRSYCEMYADMETGSSVGLNLREGQAIGHQGVATPLGPFPLEFFRRATATDCLQEAAQVFPWWDEKPTDAFWQATLRAVLWTEVPWRAPRTDWEDHIRAATFAIAKRLEPKVAPEIKSALSEYEILSARDDVFTAPSSTGMGYLRGKSMFVLPGPWRIDLPGYYIESSEDDGGTVCVWFGSEEIRGTSLTITTQNPDGVTWTKALDGRPTQSGRTCIYRLLDTPRRSRDESGYSQVAEFRAMNGDDCLQILILSLYTAADNPVLRLAEIARDVVFQRPRSTPYKAAAN